MKLARVSQSKEKHSRELVRVSQSKEKQSIKIVRVSQGNEMQSMKLVRVSQSNEKRNLILGAKLERETGIKVQTRSRTHHGLIFWERLPPIT
jgi:hypothetical protein